MEYIIPESRAVQKQAKVKLECLECGRKWSVSPNAADPQCPKCNSVDLDVVS
jgi:Zn finger protein HypA/HybF involved in hydrogenase expression